MNNQCEIEDCENESDGRWCGQYGTDCCDECHRQWSAGEWTPDFEARY